MSPFKLLLFLKINYINLLKKNSFVIPNQKRTFAILLNLANYILMIMLMAI